MTVIPVKAGIQEAVNPLGLVIGSSPAWGYLGDVVIKVPRFQYNPGVFWYDVFTINTNECTPNANRPAQCPHR